MKNPTPLCLKDGKSERTLPRILFVCTGNTCRSPMAAAYLRSFGKHDAVSRGIAACDGEPIAENAVLALRSARIASTPENDYENHRAANVTAADMESADAIVTMTGRHTAALIFAFPQFAGKVRTMEDPVSDPYGGDLKRYERALFEIARTVDRMFSVGKREGESETEKQE